MCVCVRESENVCVCESENVCVFERVRSENERKRERGREGWRERVVLPTFFPLN